MLWGMASSQEPARKRKRRRPSDFIQFIALSIVAGFVTAGLLIPPAATAGLTASASINWFKGLPANLSDGPLSKPSQILASDGSVIATFYAENRDEVSFDQISQHMKDAQLSIEDDSFYQHGGVDAMGIGRAVVNNLIRSDGRQGASTITQQYVNNLLIDQATEQGLDATRTMGANKGMLDKIKEMKLAISMEQNKSKDEILNGYLNIVNYGGSNYGVQAAAQYYWGIDAKDLNIQQSALLAGMVQSPQAYDPVTNPKNAKARRDTVLYTMHEHGKITDDEYDKALNSGLDLDVHTKSAGCTAATNAKYFCNYVTNQILADSRFGENPDKRNSMLNRGGLKIQTTMNPKAQKTAESEVEQTQPTDNNPDNVNTSLVSVQPGTGNILSMAQNSHFGVDSNSSSTTTYNYNVDSAYGGTPGFEPGSTFKAFSLAEWFKEGNGANASVDASVLSYPAGYQWNAKCKSGGKVTNPGANGAWSFQNDEQGYNWNGMSVNYGIYNSINSALYGMDTYLDLCGIGDTAQSLGVTQPSKDGGRERIATEDNLAALIGTQQVTPLSMANAYATFAADGMYCTPRAIDSVTTRDGSKMDIPKSQCSRQLDTDVARAMSYVLKNVLTEGSGYQRGIELPNASAAKTGTTDNSTQTWMIGYTKGIATASWVGNLANGSRSLNGLSINGTTRSYVDGATVAGKQWQDYMNAVKNDYDHGTFQDPSSKLQGSHIVSSKAS